MEKEIKRKIRYLERELEALKNPRPFIRDQLARHASKHIEKEISHLRRVLRD
ncbi:hypothetical protein IC619_002660 [Hazenella sp. IB182353]|uniref:hypothetical protein n=1 Tax=Polycladospora coralii TaxID=2771432 RepID=UPI001746CA9A|nr:hypothetical protein [Polycladospora coralii]MBS7529398.1 hypothetical protein [Polycladospora coralii]